MTSRMARAALPWLLMLSGFCGISYEILYNRLLGNLLGNQFFVSATVLLTFLLGIGLGTLYAHRFARFLWLIELGIGAYAAVMALAYPWIGELLYAWVPLLGGNVATVSLVAFTLLGVPAFLIGCSVPLFAGYLGTLRASGVFAVTYGIYNLGAALTALAMEFALLRIFGIRDTTLILAMLNGVVALGVLGLTRTAPLIPEPAREHVRFPGRVLAALAVASVASAVFQLLLIKIAEFIFGPYNETFALVLATVLLGLALGSLAVARLGLTFLGALLLCLAGLAWILGALPGAITVYASLHPSAASSYPSSVLLKLALTFVLMGLPAVGFGSTIPALLKTYKNIARESGQLLFCSSLANVLGFLVMAFVLHRFLDYGPILLLIVLVTLSALVIHAGRSLLPVASALVLTAAAGVAFLGFWDETLLYLGHTSFHSAEELKKSKSARVFADRFKGPRDVFAILWKDDAPYFFINGYLSIPMSGEDSSERMVGALSSMLAPRTDKALVLGMGSGATAGTVGLVFDRTDVVEINGAVLENLHRMREYNFDVESIPGLRIVHDDGIRFIRTSRESYSLILNTVTTPLYFSSSKLYTRDFFEMVRARLAPDGVYITWVDARVGDRGIDIILNTLADSFGSCWLNYMDADYFVLACSDGELGVRQHEAVASNETLRRHFAEEHTLPVRLLPYSVLATRALDLRSTGALPVNTLDYPALEFEMAQISEWQPLEAFLRTLHGGLDLHRLQAVLGRTVRWDPAEFGFFTDLRLREDSTLRRTLRNLLPHAFAESGEEYDDVVLALAAELDTSAAYMRYGQLLLDRGRDEAALALFDGALRRNPLHPGANYAAGRILLDSEDYEGALARFLAEWEVVRDESTALGIGLALTGLERPDEAAPWLERAGQGSGSAERPDGLPKPRAPASVP